MATNQAGMINEKNVSCRPAIWPNANSSMPETFARVMMGSPRPPNATGEVLANRASAAAYSGEKPKPISSAAEMATGVPNPAAPSRKRAEAEGDQQGLHPLVGRNGRHRPLDNLELAGANRQVVEKDRVQDDPADGQQSEASAVSRRRQGRRRAAF